MKPGAARAAGDIEVKGKIGFGAGHTGLIFPLTGEKGAELSWSLPRERVILLVLGLRRLRRGGPSVVRKRVFCSQNTHNLYNFGVYPRPPAWGLVKPLAAIAMEVLASERV